MQSQHSGSSYLYIHFFIFYFFINFFLGRGAYSAGSQKLLLLKKKKKINDKTILYAHILINTNFHELRDRGRSVLPGGADDGSRAASLLSKPRPSARESTGMTAMSGALPRNPQPPIQTPPTGPVCGIHSPACNSPICLSARSRLQQDISKQQILFPLPPFF